MTFKAHPAKAGPSAHLKTFPWSHLQGPFCCPLPSHTHRFGAGAWNQQPQEHPCAQSRDTPSPQSGSVSPPVCVYHLRPEGLRPG